jgi:nucleotide-binding universal stress UspA family protein
MIDDCSGNSVFGDEDQRRNKMSTPIKRYGIVVGVDGSAASDAAVVWAAREAATRNVPMMLVHMFKTFVPTFPQIPMPGGVGVWQEDDGRKVLEQAVKIAEDAVPAGRKISIATEVKSSPPVPTLIELSEEAEMIVVGSNGRGAAARVVLGSVSSGVVHGAKCPVAVIRAEASSTPRPE